MKAIKTSKENGVTWNIPKIKLWAEANDFIFMQ